MDAEEHQSETAFIVSLSQRLAAGVTLTLLFVGVFVALLASNPPRRLQEDLLRDIVAFHLFIVPWIIIHEAVHIFAGLILGAFPFSAIRFGIVPGAWTPGIVIREPITVKDLRRILIAPFLFSAILCSALVLWLPGTFTTLFGPLSLGSCSTDLLQLFKLRALNGETLIRDDPVRVGFVIAESPSLIESK